jgi:hypothetical protein
MKKEMQLHERLHLERKKGIEISHFMNQRGWKRDVPNNAFNKGIFNAYFFHPYLVFNFTNKSKNTHHRIKLF